VPLNDLGVLFEEALETGTTHLLKQKQHRHNTSVAKSDIEAHPFNLGRGKYLFLNRQLSKAQVDKYAALGYRFASTPLESKPHTRVDRAGILMKRPSE
jgi:hypothetical protein